MTRISDLTRRDWNAGAEEIAAEITSLFRSPYGAMSLRPIQGVFILEACERRGGICNALVGAGKTIPSFILPTAMRARRPLLVLPAARKKPTRKLFKELAKHWKAPDYLRIESYSFFSDESNAEALEAYAPDLIIADEAQALKSIPTPTSRGSAVARRFLRFFEAHPETMFCGLSATLTEGSILDYWHLVKWALGPGAPVPLDKTLAQIWASIIDESPKERLDDLTALTSDLGACANVTEARKRYRDRLLSTPGIVVSTEAFRDVPLTFTPIVLIPPDELDGLFADLRSIWAAPDGWDFADARFEVWGCAVQLALGFFYRHDPWPPDLWFGRRRAWCKTVREIILASETYDSQQQVALAAEALELGDDAIEAYLDWREIEPTFEINKVPTWYSDYALRAAQEWGERQNAPAIVWVDFVAFGEELSRRTRWPYFREGGRDQKKRYVEDVEEPVIICSGDSCGEGANLQYYCRNLYTSPPTTSREWEQRTGRTHRSLQRNPVTVDYFVLSREHLNALGKALDRAGFAEDTMAQPQKIIDWGLTLPYDRPRPDHKIWSQTQGERS